MIELIEAELDRLARQRQSPEAFEALFRVLWLWRAAMEALTVA